MFKKCLLVLVSLLVLAGAAPTQKYIWVGFATGTSGPLVVLQGQDGVTWYPSNSSYTPCNAGGFVRDPDVAYFSALNKFYLVHTNTTVGVANTTFDLAVSTDASTFTCVQQIDMSSVSSGGGSQVWAPNFAHNSDGSVWLDGSGCPHVYVAASSNGLSDSGFKIYEVHPNTCNNLAGTWSAPVAITGTSLPTNFIDAFPYVTGTTIQLWYKDENTKFVGYMTTSTATPTSGFAVIKSGDWVGWGNDLEGPSVIALGPNALRLYLDPQGNGGIYHVESFDNGVTWNSGLVRMTAPIVTQHGTVITNPNAVAQIHNSSPGALLGVSSTADGMYANFIKAAGFFAGGTPKTGAIFDNNGYPNNLASCPTCWTSGDLVAFAPLPSNLGTGTTVLEFTNGGAITLFGTNIASLTIDQAVTGTGCTFTGTNASLSSTNATASCRVAFHYTAGAPGSQEIHFPFGATYTNMSFLIWCKLANESAITTAGAGGIVFDPQYISTVSSLHLSKMRFMGVEGGASALNGFPTSPQFNYRLPLTSVTGVNGYLPQTALLASTGALVYQASPEQYTGGPSPDMSTTAWVDKEFFWAFTPAGSANTTTTPQVCITGRTPTCKTLLSSASGAAICVSGSCGNGQNSIGAGSFQLFIYDATLNGVLTWGDTRLLTGLPVEVAVALCNQLGIGMWWNIPHLYSNASVTAVAQKIQSTLAAAAPRDYEYSNEMWSTGWSQQGYAKTVAAALGLPAGNSAYFYGMKVQQVGALIAAADPTARMHLNGQWTAYAFSNVDGMLSGNAICTTISATCTNPSASYTGADMSVLGNRPVDIIKAAGYANYTQGNAFSPYFSGNTVPTNAIAPLITAASDWASGDATRRQRALDFAYWDIRQGGGNGVYTTATSGYYNQFEYGIDAYAGTGNVPAGGLAIEPYEGGDQSNSPTPTMTVAAAMEGAAVVYNSGNSYTTGNIVIATDLNLYTCSSTCATNDNPTGGGGTNWTASGRSVSGNLSDLLTAFKNDARFGKLQSESYGIFMSYPHSRIPAQLQLTGPNMFSILNSDVYGTQRASFGAIQAFDSGSRGRPFN